jgi:hypothetical protein
MLTILTSDPSDERTRHDRTPRQDERATGGGLTGLS